MIKYYIKKLMMVKLRDEAPNYSVGFESTLTLYDTFDEAWNRIIREEINIINRNSVKIEEYSKDQIVKEFNKEDINFSYTTKEDDLGGQVFKFKSVENGLKETIKNELTYLEITQKIYSIDTSNMLYGLISTKSNATFTEMDIVDNFVEFREDLFYVKELWGFRHKDSHCSYAMFDKSELRNDVDIARSAMCRYLEGEVSSKTLDYFNKDVLKEALFKSMDDIKREISSLKDDIKNKDSEIKKFDEVEVCRRIENKDYREYNPYCKHCISRNDYIEKLENDNIIMSRQLKDAKYALDRLNNCLK